MSATLVGSTVLAMATAGLLIVGSTRTPDPDPIGRLVWASGLFAITLLGVADGRRQWRRWRAQGSLDQAWLAGVQPVAFVRTTPCAVLARSAALLVPWVFLPALSVGLLAWTAGEVLRALFTVVVWCLGGVAMGMWASSRGWSAGATLALLAGLGALPGPWIGGAGSVASGPVRWILHGLGRWTPLGAMTPTPAWTELIWWGTPVLLTLLLLSTWRWAR